MLNIFITITICLIVELNATSSDADIIAANDLDHYIRYASYVFLPNETEPIKSKLKNKAEEKQIHLMHKNSNLKSKLLEGDILISERVLFNDKLRKKRKIINVINSRTDFNTRWPNKTVI